MLKSKLFLGAAVIALALSVNTSAEAADQDIGASADFRQALTLADAQDMDFGTIEYTGSANGNISLATNGTVTYTSGYSGAGTGTEGRVTIQGTTGEAVDVSCEASGTLSDGSNTFALQSTEVVVGAGVAFGSGTACAGLGSSPVSHTITGTVSDNYVRIGAQIDGSTTPTAAGVYDTSAGDPVTVRVVYQ